jgi:hypothetical protein
VRDEWIAAVNELVIRVEGWCKELDWATRRAPKRITDDHPIGHYAVPMLRMQHWDIQVLLEPASRFGVRNDGQCDLYTSCPPTITWRSSTAAELTGLSESEPAME